MKTKLSLFTLAALGSLITSCGDRASQNAIAEVDESPTNERELVIFNWEDYISDEVVAAFTEETGIHVRLEYFENLAELKGRLKSNPESYDLIVVDDVTLAELAEVRLLSPIDKNLLPNFKNLDARYVDQDFDPQNSYSVPYTWGTTLVAYRADRIDSPDPSWNLLWNEELTGKVVMLDSEPDLYSIALLSLGYSVKSEDEKQLRECTEKLVGHAKSIQATYAELSTAKELLQTGQAWAAVMFSGDAAMLAEDDENISYFIPKEGAPLWLDSLVISREAQNRTGAHQFLDYLLRAEVAAQNSNYLWTGTPNAAAEAFLDPEFKADQSINPPNVILSKCDFCASPSGRRNSIMNQGMKKIFDTVRAQFLAKGDSDAAPVPESEFSVIAGEEPQETSQTVD